MHKLFPTFWEDFSSFRGFARECHFIVTQLAARGARKNAPVTETWKGLFYAPGNIRDQTRERIANLIEALDDMADYVETTGPSGDDADPVEDSAALTALLSETKAPETYTLLDLKRALGALAVLDDIDADQISAHVRLLVAARLREFRDVFEIVASKLPEKTD